MESRLSRRGFVGLAGVAALSTTGCLDGSTPDVPDLLLFNDTNESVAVTTVVTRISDDEQVFRDTATISVDETRRYSDPIPEGVTVRIRVSIEDDLERRYEWDAPADESYGIHVEIGDGDIGVREVVS